MGTITRKEEVFSFIITVKISTGFYLYISKHNYYTTVYCRKRKKKSIRNDSMKLYLAPYKIKLSCNLPIL